MRCTCLSYLALPRNGGKLKRFFGLHPNLPYFGYMQSQSMITVLIRFHMI
jgi:hypothetical protein